MNFNIKTWQWKNIILWLIIVYFACSVLNIIIKLLFGFRLIGGGFDGIIMVLVITAFTYSGFIEWRNKNVDRRRSYKKTY